MNKLILLLLLSISILFASIDVNKASKSDFMQIKGIGAKKAQSIIDYRKKHGKFKSISDLKNVKGIGSAIVKNVQNGTKTSQKSASKSSKTTKSTTKSKKKLATKKKDTTKAKQKKSKSKKSSKSSKKKKKSSKKKK